MFQSMKRSPVSLGEEPKGQFRTIHKLTTSEQSGLRSGPENSRGQRVTWKLSALPQDLPAGKTPMPLGWDGVALQCKPFPVGEA